MSGNLMSPGDVIRIRFPYSDPPKQKISLCICLDHGLFFIISTKKYQWAPADSQITIFKEELGCLDYDSYLDVSKAYEIDSAIISKGVAGGVFRLADSALNRIVFAISSQGYLPENQKRLALANLEP